MTRSSENRKTTPRAANTDRLREDIDRGGTGDKVAFSDPAASPLGTDAEAAGNPPRSAEVHKAQRHETRHAAAANRKETPAERQQSAFAGNMGLVIILTIVALVLLALVAWYF